MCFDWNYHDNSDHYYDTADGGNVKRLTVGSVEPVMHLNTPFPSLAEAQKVSTGSAKPSQLSQL